MAVVLNIFRSLVNSNIYISLAAVMLTIATQIQLGMKPELHPYLFLIFFATLCEYNVHRFITVITKKAALESPKHKWVKDNLIGFYLLVFLSVVGFFVVALMAKREVLFGLAPIALLTLFYSIPVYGNKKTIFRLRGIPYLKIFMISFTWSAATILLPVIHTGLHFPPYHVILMLLERFVFVFAITIPFDTRDMEADKAAKLRTLPLLLGEDRAMRLSYSSVVVFAVLCIVHYAYANEFFILVAMLLSAISTIIFLKWDHAKKLPLYHYAILDGTMMLQGALVLAFSYLH
jgi:4-hydroxybenzoate polyprenyltransferase